MFISYCGHIKTSSGLTTLGLSTLFLAFSFVKICDYI